MESLDQRPHCGGESLLYTPYWDLASIPARALEEEVARRLAPPLPSSEAGISVSWVVALLGIALVIAVGFVFCWAGSAMGR